MKSSAVRTRKATLIFGMIGLQLKRHSIARTRKHGRSTSIAPGSRPGRDMTAEATRARDDEPALCRPVGVRLGWVALLAVGERRVRCDLHRCRQRAVWPTCRTSPA